MVLGGHMVRMNGTGKMLAYLYAWSTIALANSEDC